MKFFKPTQDERYVLLGILMLVVAALIGPRPVNPDRLDSISLVLKGAMRQGKGRNSEAYYFSSKEFPCRFAIGKPGGEATVWMLDQLLRDGDSLHIRYAPAGVLQKDGALAHVYALSRGDEPLLTEDAYTRAAARQGRRGQVLFALFGLLSLARGTRLLRGRRLWWVGAGIAAVIIALRLLDLW